MQYLPITEGMEVSKDCRLTIIVLQTEKNISSATQNYWDRSQQSIYNFLYRSSWLAETILYKPVNGWSTGSKF